MVCSFLARPGFELEQDILFVTLLVNYSFKRVFLVLRG